MKRVSFLVLSSLCSMLALAQDAKLDVNINKSGSSNFPWIWIVGGAVFVLLLVALLSGRRRA